jgi:hypothetical protein
MAALSIKFACESMMKGSVIEAYGIDPLLFLVAATSFPKTESE